MSDAGRAGRQAVGDLKRGLILAAARRVFEAEGLEGASLRAIAAAAGYTPAALYFHFDSKEAIYAEVLRASLARLGEAVDGAVAKASTPAARLRAAAMAFFTFYAENSARPRPRILPLPRRHEAPGSGPGPRQRAERRPRGRASPHRRGGGGAGRRPRGRASC